MQLINFWYECKSCRITFKSPQLPGNPYGEFLLRNQDGKIAYLNAFDCDQFTDFSRLFDDDQNVIKLEKKQSDNIFQTIVGLICDQSNKHNYYSITQNPKCPYCNKSEYSHWGPTDPPEIVNIVARELTFIKWDNLTITEKREQVAQAIEMYPLIKSYQEGTRIKANEGPRIV